MVIHCRKRGVMSLLSDHRSSRLSHSASRDLSLRCLGDGERDNQVVDAVSVVEDPHSWTGFLLSIQLYLSPQVLHYSGPKEISPDLTQLSMNKLFETSTLLHPLLDDKYH